MSKLVEHKDMIHVGTEVVVLAGLAYYFHRKTGNLSTRVNELQEHVTKLEEALKSQVLATQNLGSYVSNLNELVAQMNIKLSTRQPSPYVPSPLAPTPRKAPTKPQTKRTVAPQPQPASPPIRKPKIRTHSCSPLQIPHAPVIDPVSYVRFEEVESEKDESEEVESEKDESEKDEIQVTCSSPEHTVASQIEEIVTSEDDSDLDGDIAAELEELEA
jgi:hypothetical protein